MCSGNCEEDKVRYNMSRRRVLSITGPALGSNRRQEVIWKVPHGSLSYADLGMYLPYEVLPAIVSAGACFSSYRCGFEATEVDL